MSKISDELRKWCDLCGGIIDSGDKAELHAIADRIDAEHESKVSYWQGASYKDGYDEGFASADDWLADHEDAMAEHGWVKLPRDRDGVPIHVGDTVYLDDGQKAEVTSIVLAECASVINCWTYGKSFAYMSSGISHKPADSWESIADELDEMVDAADSADDRCEKFADLAERIRKLAAKEGER